MNFEDLLPSKFFFCGLDCRTVFRCFAFGYVYLLPKLILKESGGLTNLADKDEKLLRNPLLD